MAGTHGYPFQSVSFAPQRSPDRGRPRLGLLKAKCQPMMRGLDVVESSIEHDASLVDESDAIGHTFDLVEQVRGEKNSATFLRDSAYDRAEDVLTNNGVQSTRWFIEYEE